MRCFSHVSHLYIVCFEQFLTLDLHIQSATFHGSPKVNCILELFHKTLKFVFTVRKNDWMLLLPIAHLSVRYITNNSGFSLFQAVTSQISLCPTELFSSLPQNKWVFDTFMKSFISLIKELQVPRTYVSETLKTYRYVCLGMSN